MAADIPTLYVLGLSPSRLSAIRPFLRSGHVTLVDDIASPAKDLADAFVRTESRPAEDDVVAALMGLTVSRPARGVISLRDNMLPVAARITERFDLTGISYEAARICLNKDRMRATLALAGVSQPAFRSCSSVAEATDFARSVGYPLCLKPSNRDASQGVFRIDSRDELVSHYPVVDRLRLRGEGFVIAEEWLDGPEFSVEAVTVDGSTQILCATGKHLGGGGSLVEMGHELPRRDADGIGELVVAALDACGIDNSFTHTEIKLTERGPQVVEINGRLGGDYIPDLMALSGVGNPYQSLVELATTGRIVSPIGPWSRGAAIRFFAPGCGTVVGIHGVERASTLPNVVDIDIYTRIGGQVGPLTNSMARSGHLIATGVDAMSAGRYAEDAAAHITFEIAAGCK